MVYFNQKFCADALKYIKLRDDADVTNDWCEIAFNMAKLNNFPTIEDIRLALALDERLCQKYAIINTLFDVANKLSRGMNNLQNKVSDESSSAVKLAKDRLTQDCFGILCHMLIKKQIITSVEQFIDHIE